MLLDGVCEGQLKKSLLTEGVYSTFGDMNSKSKSFAYAAFYITGCASGFYCVLKVLFVIGMCYFFDC